ncbi:MAG TPA: hypothetical protein VJO35_07035 [Terriglobales bacterium]|nr:hypothetical protein [Terriglobales bacterium]
MRKPNTTGGELSLLGQLAAAVSIAGFFYYLRHGDLLLYGDAVAHINIARRVFDSLTPGPLQLGTVWLPLPHVLMLPFLASKFLWQTGIGGSIPSLVAFVLSVIGIFRLMQIVLPSNKTGARFAPWLAAGIFALNPNLIYLQTTAMTEAIYLAFFVWSLVFFAQALRDHPAAHENEAKSSLSKAGFCVFAACLARYDGWFLGAIMVALLSILAFARKSAFLRAGVKRFVLLAAAGPILWIGYNALVYRNPLEFANGPYSAKAIEQKTSIPGTPPHPGTHDLPAAFHYFFKSAQLNLAAGKWQIFWVCALLFGTAVVILFQKKLWPLLLLWAPVPFYMLSIAYSGVPLFVPVWWPFSRYNVRYGVEMLPAFAVFTAVAVYGLARFAANRTTRLTIGIIFLLLVAGSYAQVWRKGPESFQEAVANSRSRITLEAALASNLELLPSNSTFLMYLGDHVGAFQRAGIPFKQVINEGNHRPWKQPTDPDGLWEHALQHPAKYADYVIALENDPVASGANKNELASLLVLRVSGQPEATVYKTVKK